MRASDSSRRSPSSRSHPLLRLAVILLLALGIAPAFAGAPAAAANSSITINAHTCPYGTDLTTLNYYDLAAACQGQGAFDYTVNGANGYAQQVNAGLSTLSGLDPSTYYITQGDYSATYGPPVAYCNINDDLGNDVPGGVGVFTSVVSGSQGPIELAVDGYNAFCDTFNAEGTPTTTTPTPGTVTIYKYGCPDGTPSNQTETDYLAACTTPMGGVDFKEGNHSGSKSTVTTDNGGQVSFAVDPDADWSIEEVIPSGYDENPLAFCAWNGYQIDTNGNSAPASGAYNLGPNGGTTLRFDTYDQFQMTCNVFNLPSTGTGTGYTQDADVFISKWECPEGYSSDAYDDLSSSCTRELEGIDFTITHESGDSATDNTGGQPARAAFTPWYNGASTITESIPDGYGSPVVYCRATDDFNDPLPGYELTNYPVTDGSIDIMIPDAAPNTIVSFFCDWYNTIDQPTYGGIYVHKYGCPQGYSIDSSFDELAGGCWTIVHGAEFEVSGPGSYSDSQTISGETDLAWENLAPGDYRVTEQEPQGYRDSMVYCSTGAYGDAAGSSYKPTNFTTDGIDVSIEGGSYVDCVWYNIPPPPSSGGKQTPTTTQPAGPATVVIVKYTCKEDYDVYKAKADPTKDCDETTDDVSFTIRGGKNSSLTKVTGDGDDAGTVTFSGLPAGSYLLQEEYPERVSAAFVWECNSTVRGWVYAFAPFAVIGPDGATKINVVPGETLTCSWYDVLSPKQSDGNGTSGEPNVSVTVLDCPGSVVNRSTCTPADAGVAVSLTAADKGDDAELETDQDGVAAGAVQPGGYDLEVKDGICFADSDAFDNDGLLTVDNDPVVVTVYRCGA